MSIASRPFLLTALCSLLLACSESGERISPMADSAPSSPAMTAAPRSPSGNDWGHGFMAAVANPFATEAAAEMLAEGGHAVDAAIAAHAVLGLVEPESSGLGGGGFMLVFDADSEAMHFFDGRETAPAAATADMFMRDDAVMGFMDAWQSGHAVGVPGAVALYRLVHDAYGTLPWERVFEPAIRLAREGFPVTAKMAGLLPRIAGVSGLDENPGAAEYFYPNGQALRAGDMLRNPEYAETLQRIATEGPSAFYEGEIAEAIVAAAQAEPNGGSLSMEDMANYEAERREAVCGPWRELTICSATPPSSGAMQIMIANLYDRLLPQGADRMQQVRSFVDAQRLAYADRDHYFGDPDQVDVPLDQLLHPDYLDSRAAQPVPPGELPRHGDPASVLGESTQAGFGADSTLEAVGTTHFSIIDDQGNAVSATMTVESAFGTTRWAAGFVLNNEMTDFSREYRADAPEPANMVRPGARPRSSMSPAIILDENQELLMVTGSPGGNSIPAYTAKTILGILDWGLTVQEAVNFPNVIARGQTVRIEVGVEPGPEIAETLGQAGYPVQTSQGENSGLHVILVGDEGLIGAADPRREGTVMSRAPMD